MDPQNLFREVGWWLGMVPAAALAIWAWLVVQEALLDAYLGIRRKENFRQQLDRWLATARRGIRWKRPGGDP